MRRRLPSIDALKVKVKDIRPELLSVIDQKEIEWLKRIDIQAKEDNKTSKERSERFDW